MSRIPPYPYLKWAGGKARLAGRVIQRLPTNIDTYYEPFLGGGGVFFELARSARFKKAVLADSNGELINTWKAVKESVDELVRALKKPEFVYERQSYLAVRAADPSSLSPVERAARFIYLNRTCFNGLYRVNSSGRFNVPFGQYVSPVICDEDNLRAVSKILANTKILHGDFETACGSAKEGDAVYFDPPYIPISSTSKFTGYTIGGFDDESHRRLAALFGRLGDQGCRVVLSNSAASLAMELYSKYDVDSYTGTRSVGGPPEYRRPAREILVFHGARSHEHVSSEETQAPQ